MRTLEEKLEVLEKIAERLNNAGITWCVGASALLYFKGYVKEFNDLDILVVEGDLEKLMAEFEDLGGKLLPSDPDLHYKTRHFLEYEIDGVEADVMAGFIITYMGKDYDCSLQPEQITEYAEAGGEKIPLQTLGRWKCYYELMEREKKVEILKDVISERDTIFGYKE